MLPRRLNDLTPCATHSNANLPLQRSPPHDDCAASKSSVHLAQRMLLVEEAVRVRDHDGVFTCRRVTSGYYGPRTCQSSRRDDPFTVTAYPAGGATSAASNQSGCRRPPPDVRV